MHDIPVVLKVPGYEGGRVGLADNLDVALDTVKRWGIEDDNGVIFENAYGQFRVGPSGAHFEIVAVRDE